MIQNSAKPIDFVNPNINNQLLCYFLVELTVARLLKNANGNFFPLIQRNPSL